jgi:UDP-glucose 4-epimerase
MTPRKVMLIGGGGFIGSALVCRLKQVDYAVTVITRENLASVPSLLGSHDTVVHLASCTTPGSSSAEPALEQYNIALTKWLTELLVQSPGVQLVYFSSGGTVYGNQTVLPVTEDAVLAPLSNYGTAKIEQEDLCNTLREHGTRVTVLRPSNAYGPGQSLKTGFGLVRTLLEHAYRGTPVAIWGDGTALRDYLFINDIVEAVILIAESPDIQGTFNLGSGSGHSINNMKSMVETICKVRIDATYKPSRDIDVRSIVLDTSRLRQKIAWAPKVKLEEGIHRTWQWILKI